MNRIVSIFGGIGTKESHYTHAIEVYASNGYTTYFYENLTRDILFPKRFAKTSEKARCNDPYGNIIHCNSGGTWVGLDYLSKTIDNKLFVCEAGPLECDTKELISVFEKIYNCKCPNIITKNINIICDRIGIPHNDNEEWNKKYNNDLNKIKNILCLTSKNDKIINNEYITNLVKQMNKHDKIANRYEFDTGSHWNISKFEKQKYQDILQTQLNKLSN